MPRLLDLRGVGEHDGAACGQRPEDVPHGQVKPQIGECDGPIFWPDMKTAVDVDNRVDGGPMADHDALGRARGAGRVDDIGQIGLRLYRLAIPQPGPIAFGQRVHGDQGHSLHPFKVPHQAELRQDEAHPGVTEDELHALAGHGGIKGQIGRSRVLDAKHGDGLLPSLFHDHGHQLVGLHLPV